MVVAGVRRRCPIEWWPCPKRERNQICCLFVCFVKNGYGRSASGLVRPTLDRRTSLSEGSNEFHPSHLLPRETEASRVSLHWTQRNLMAATSQFQIDRAPWKRKRMSWRCLWRKQVC